MDSKKFYDKAKSYMKLAPDATLQTTTAKSEVAR